MYFEEKMTKSFENKKNCNDIKLSWIKKHWLLWQFIYT